MRVYIDFSFTILNREHFSASETFSGRQIKFTFDSPAQGNRRYIPVDDLYERNFTDSNGEFQLELTLASPRTLFETEVRLPLPPGIQPQHGGGGQHSASPTHGHHQQHVSGNSSVHHQPQHHHQQSHHHHHHHHQQQQLLPKSAKVEVKGLGWAIHPIFIRVAQLICISWSGRLCCLFQWKCHFVMQWRRLHNPVPMLIAALLA